MYKKMLVPLDGSETAEILFPYAKYLAARMGLETTFLYVSKPHESQSSAIYRSYVEHTAEKIAAAAAKIREKEGPEIQARPLKFEGKVKEGHPAEEILQYTGEKDIDLLLMATHGRSGIRRWALGSVADKVLRTAVVPVLLVRATDAERISHDEGKIERIVVSLDGSEMGESVLPHVETLVKQWGADSVEIVLLMVAEPVVLPPLLTPDAPVNWGNIVEEHIAYSKKAAGEYLNGVANRLIEAGLKVSLEVKEGLPGAEIINYAEENSHILIAMATHGRSGIGRWTYGSVAEKVLSGATRPVFLVRPPEAGGLPTMQAFVGTVKSIPPVI